MVSFCGFVQLLLTSNTGMVHLNFVFHGFIVLFG